MTTENNKLTMQRFTKLINTASKKLAVELIFPNAVFHVPGSSESMRGPLAIIGMMRGGFPDIQWTLEELKTEGDKVRSKLNRSTPGSPRSIEMTVEAPGNEGRWWEYVERLCATCADLNTRRESYGPKSRF